LKKFLTYSPIFLGAVLALVGTAFVAMYFWEAIITKIGDSDQSLMFWYLPFMFIGLAGILAGLALLTWGMNRMRNSQKNNADERDHD
jgi:uncharacterized membrane protein